MRVSNLSKTIFKTCNTTLLLACFFYSSIGYAASGAAPDAAGMLENFADTVPQLMRMITALAYVLGMFLIMSALFKMKEFSEQRTMMSSSHDLKGPLFLFVAGTALLYLPSSVQVGLNTFWGDPNPYGYVQETTDQWSTLYQDIFLVVQLIGTIAFIRGLLLLAKSGKQGQPGDFAKAMTYIIAGTMCINLYDFLAMMNNTLGLTGVMQ